MISDFKRATAALIPLVASGRDTGIPAASLDYLNVKRFPSDRTFSSNLSASMDPAILLGDR